MGSRIAAHFANAGIPSVLLDVTPELARKGVETAIRALALLPEEASLTIIGAGVPGYRDHLVTLAASLGVKSRISRRLQTNP